MNKKLVTAMVVVASIALTAGVVQAAGMTADWLRVGAQGEGGVTYFNGTILNDTTGDNDADNPVTFGDNVRIDGRVYRGATAGTSDTLPFIVNDNMEVTGDLTVTGTVTTASLQELITGTVSASGDFNKAALSTTTWTGTAYDVCENEMRETSVTVTFTPTSSSEGTWTSSEINLFNAGLVCFSESVYPRGTYSGSYKTIEDLIFVYNVQKPDESSTGVGYTALAKIRGNTITITDARTSPQVFSVLTRQ